MSYAETVDPAVTTSAATGRGDRGLKNCLPHKSSAL